MEAQGLALIAGGVLAFALVSRRAEAGILTAPLVFTLFGFMVGPGVLDLVDLELRTSFINSLAEATLVLVLFTDAARIDVSRLNRQHSLPVRLLCLGLPLSIALGGALGLILFPGCGLWEALVLATILAPTDAALGQAVVNNKAVPVRIRQALNVESGLNDGLAFPVLLVFASLAGGGEARGLGDWLLFIAAQLALGPLTGLAVGLIGAFLVAATHERGWMSRVFLQISVLSLALLAYGIAEIVGGNGFIAAFTAGLTIGTRSHLLRKPLEDFGETEGQLLSLMVFLLFGATMLPRALDALTTSDVAYAVLSLTLVRMLPVAVSLWHARLKPVTVLFIGWFGPRGLASILYLLLIVEEGEVGSADALFVTVVITVLASIVGHGMTSAQLARAYGAHLHRHRAALEHRPVEPVFPTRHEPQATGSDSDRGALGGGGT